MLSIKFCTKKLVGARVYLPRNETTEGSKDWYVSNIIFDMFQISYCTEMGISCGVQL